jgi:hypothetical protein
MSLNPRENRTQREAKKARLESRPPPSLEPAFPYSKVYFDPFVFEGLTVDSAVQKRENLPRRQSP